MADGTDFAFVAPSMGMLDLCLKCEIDSLGVNIKRIVGSLKTYNTEKPVGWAKEVRRLRKELMSVEQLLTEREASHG